MARVAVNIFHLLAVVPLLVYLAAVAPSIPRWRRIPLVVLGALLILYHGGRAVRELREGGERASTMVRVRLAHVLIAGPLFIYLGLASSPLPALPAAAAALVFLFHGARVAQHFLSRPRPAGSSSPLAPGSRTRGRKALDEGMEEIMILEEAAI